MKRLTAKNVAGLAVLTALALIAFVIENLLPPLFIPGAKPGLGNIFVLLALLFYGGAGGFLTVVIKALLGCALTGNVSALMYSLPAGITALVFEYTFIKCAFPRVSLPAISVGAAVLHNAVQNVIFCLVTGWEAIAFLPYLALIGAVSGLIVGIAAFTLTKLLPEKFYHNYTNITGG